MLLTGRQHDSSDHTHVQLKAAGAFGSQIPPFRLLLLLPKGTQAIRSQYPVLPSSPLKCNTSLLKQGSESQVPIMDILMCMAGS